MVNKKWQLAMGLLAIASASAAQAKEIAIRCDLTSRGTISGRDRPEEKFQKYFIIDDVNQKIWVFSTGAKSNPCPPIKNDVDICDVKINDSAIMIHIKRSDQAKLSMFEKIDRLSGRISQSISIQIGSSVSLSESDGECVPVSLQARKF